MRGRLENFKKIETQPDEGENKINEILILIGELFDLRIVQRICRPSPYLQKEQFYLQFKLRFQSLHELMRQVQREYLLESGNTEKSKSFHRTTVNNRTKYQREDIRRIENRYTEVFIEGSFRYYYRAAKAFGMPTDLEAINVEEWIEETFKEDAENKCC